MATCPKCRGKMGQTDVICPRCGYDFPDSDAGWTRSRGFAHSRFANLVLVVGQVVAGIGCLFAILAAAVALANGEVLAAMVGGPLGALLSLAMMVVFARVQEIE